MTTEEIYEQLTHLEQVAKQLRFEREGQGLPERLYTADQVTEDDYAK